MNAGLTAMTLMMIMITRMMTTIKIPMYRIKTIIIDLIFLVLTLC